MKRFAVKSVFLFTSALLSVGTAHADGLYVGAFGGIGSTADQSVEQLGTAHKGFVHTVDGQDEYYTYDLLVDVDGTNEHETAAVFGGQIGYQWNTDSAFKPAVEVEGIYLSANQRSNLVNLEDDGVTNIKVTDGGVPTAVTDHNAIDMVTDHVLETPLSAGHHTFANTSKMKVALFGLNGVFTYDTGSKLKPYVGAGAGLAFVKMGDAVSLQTGPGANPELDGGVPVNHFNSRDNAEDIAFAVQAKAGVRYQLTQSVSLFAEYRYIRLDATDYSFGSTVYPGHAPTDNWVVKNGAMSLHNGLVGVRFGF